MKSQEADTSQIFRGEEVPSKLITIFCKRFGAAWIMYALKASIEKICDESQRLEVDPDKLKPGDDIKQNQERVCNITKQILDNILRAADRIPKILQEFFLYIRKCFSNSEKIIFGSLFFLRFVCPAISLPEGHGIFKTPPSIASRRQLVLVSKILQGLANGVNFGDKESYMMGVNSFIEANQKTINELYNKLLLSKKKTRKDCKPETALVEDPVTYMSHVLQNNRQSLAKKNIINNFNTKLDAVLDSKLKPVKKSNSVEPLKLLLSTADKDAIEHPSGARSARALSFSGNSIPMNTTSLLEAEVKTLQLKFEKERLMRRELEKQIESLIKKIRKTNQRKDRIKRKIVFI